MTAQRGDFERPGGCPVTAPAHTGAFRALAAYLDRRERPPRRAPDTPDVLCACGHHRDDHEHTGPGWCVLCQCRMHSPVGVV